MTLSSKTLALLGNTIRVGLVLLYIAWVAVGLCRLRGREAGSTTRKYKATRYLPVGYRLHSYDFEFDPPVPAGEYNQLPPQSVLAGKYLLKERSAGTSIVPSDLSSAPVVATGKDMVRWLFPLEKQPDLVSVLNTNSRVDVCLGACVLEDVRVLSVVCGATSAVECYAVVEVSSAESAKLNAEKNYRLIPRQY